MINPKEKPEDSPCRHDLLALAVPGSMGTEEIKRARALFQLLLSDMPWPGFGELTILFVAGKPHKIKRTDTVVIE